MGNKEDLKAGLNELLNSKPAQKKSKTEPVSSDSSTRLTQQVENRPGRKSRMEDVSGGEQRTSLVIDKRLYQQINQIAVLNGLTYKDVMNAAMRNFIEKYEEKHGPLTQRESSISADELI